VRRWPPVVLGLIGAVIALGAAIGAGAVVRALEDEPERPEPEVELTFDGSEDESATDDLIGGEVDGDDVADISFALLEGGSMRLADLRGTPIVVNFFAEWCAPCRKEMPDFEQVHQELGDEVAFVGIDVRDSVASAERVVKETGVTYTVGRDPSGEISQQFNVVNMPSTFVLSADGEILAVHPGALDADGLRDMVRDALD
jgi:peroxiredoxin